MGNTQPSNHQPLERTNVGKFGDAHTVCYGIGVSGRWQINHFLVDNLLENVLKFIMSQKYLYLSYYLLYWILKNNSESCLTHTPISGILNN